MAEKLRYAVVGLGWIAQEAVLPGFKNAKNAELVALVTDDPEKAQEVGREYKISRTCGYNQYDDLLKSGDIDAVYIALPNSMHHDFTVRAARAGIHVLCEKPMADTVAECEEMIQAAEESGIKLMIAYRLHFETATLKAIETITSGDIGEPRIFHSAFSQQVVEGNVRLKRSLGGGPLMDMGVYPINAARYLFQAEPVEVTAFGGRSGDARFREVHEMVAAILRFPGDRLASLTSSIGAAATDFYHVIGTKGDLRLTPAYGYHEEPEMELTVNGKKKETSESQHDQFGAELSYFADCVLKDQTPEPDGYEGLADIRVVAALLESMRTGRAVTLDPFTRSQRPNRSLEMKKSAVKPPDTINVESPTGQK